MSSKILVLTKYGSLGGSSRYRFYQYLSYLKSQDFDITVAPLLDNEYITDLNRGKKNLANIILLYFQRLVRLITDKDYDLLWIEKEALPFFPVWFEKVLIGNIPYVVDYDDAQFHRYDKSESRLIRLLLSQKIDRVMANAKLVIAGNKYILDKANRSGAKRVEIIPTVIDLERYSSKNLEVQSKSFNIGWIGSPITSRYLKLIQPVFENLNQEHDCIFTMVGAGDLTLDNIDLTIKEWHENSEVEDIKTFDVGIMPLTDTPWEQGKCGIKLIQYMACSLPVVGTPIGANQEIIHHGVNGFHANNGVEWTNYLSTLAKDSHLRQEMGAQGRSIVESEYCLQVTAPKIHQLLQSCI